LKTEALKNAEKTIRAQDSDQTTDFIEYLELLVDFFKQLDLLDASGSKLIHIFTN
jgi:Asp-tRNA(Asn)/Glu-tRNA(Gln) amidotransferase C subunit